MINWPPARRFAVGAAPAGVGALDPTFSVDFSGGTLTPIAGAVAAAFTRATPATVTDWEQRVRHTLSGEARFTGLRRVHNLCQTKSEDFSNAAWTKSNCTATATTLEATAANATCKQGTAAAVTGDFVLRVKLSRVTGTGNIQLTMDNFTTATTVSLLSTDRVYSIYQTGVTNPTFGIRIVTSGDKINATQIQLENVTGNSNTNPSEYVSRGVLSTPFHGANVDGVRYFPHENGNTVASNVVTEATGATIAAATRRGVRTELSRINICLQSQDLATTWTNTASTESVNATTAPDGTATADKLVEDATGAAEHRVNQTITYTNVIHTFSAWLKAGERTWARLFLADGTTNHTAYFNLATGEAGAAGNCTSTIKAYPDGWYRCALTTNAATAAAVGSVRINIAEGNSDVTYDGDGASGIFVWGVQVEAGGFASTYIATTTASVTRNSDALSYPNTTGWFDETQGTFVYRGGIDAPGSAVARMLFSCGVDNSNLHRLQIDVGESDFETQVLVAGVVTANMEFGAVDTSLHTVAYGYKANDFATSFDGGAVVTDVSGALPAGTFSLAIGSLPTGANSGYSDCTYLHYYDTKFANSAIPALAA